MKPGKAAQKDVDARWTVKFAKARMAPSGNPQIDIAIPSFGFVRKAVVTHGARHDVSQLREVVTTNNIASDVWAYTAYRSKTNEAWLAANRAKSNIRARVEHVFAQQKAHMGLFICTIGLKRAETKNMLANLACNIQRLIFHERRAATE